jgi:hypothetical protein
MILLASLTVTACAISPERIARESDIDVCRSFGTFRASPLWQASADSYEAEVRRRKLIADDEWALVGSKKIRTGMSRCVMYASHGSPDRENRTRTAGSERVQHVYNSGYRYIKAYYIYTENDRVTAWQH